MAETRYVKGDDVKIAHTARERVRLEFNGYRAESSEDVDYRDLQARAKAAGIPANQSREALEEALTAPDGPEGDGSDLLPPQTA